MLSNDRGSSPIGAPLSRHSRKRVEGKSGGLFGDRAIAPTGRAEHYTPFGSRRGKQQLPAWVKHYHLPTPQKVRERKVW